jgi:hypothetical protein
MSYPIQTGLVLQWLYPDAGEFDYSVSMTDDGVVIDRWDDALGAQPSEQDIINHLASPEWHAHLVAVRTEQLAGVRTAALDVRRAQTWPGMSAGEVSEAIALGDPSAEAVAAYIADRAVILGAYNDAVAALAAMSSDDLTAAIEGGA